jgi:hypothetical protein
VTVHFTGKKNLVSPEDTKMHSKQSTIYPINNSSYLYIYDIDFGTSQPVSVILHDLGD